jgi:hypothetical protein
MNCRAHPSSLAAWRCGACDKFLCEECAALNHAGTGALVVCATCGALAEVLSAPRAEVDSFEDRWRDSFHWIFHPWAIFIFIVITCGTEFLSRAGPNSWVLGHAFLFAWFLIATHRASWGHAPFDAPTYAEVAGAWLEPLARLAKSAGFLALGAAVLTERGERSLPWTSLPLWLLAGVSIWLLPPALVFANIEGDGTRSPWPWKLAEQEKALGVPMTAVRGMAAVWVILNAVKALQPVLEKQDTSMGSKILLEGSIQLAAVVTLGALACVLGFFLRTHAKRLGHGDPQTWLVPILPNAIARGIWNPQMQAETEPFEHAPIELEDPADSLIKALAAGDDENAIQLFHSGGISPEKLAADTFVQLAQAMATRSAYPSAAKLLEGLIAREPNGPATPRASIILARIYAERLNQPEQAKQIYAQVVERFVGTAAAKFAAEQLKVTIEN